MLDAYGRSVPQTNGIPTSNKRHKRRKVEKDDGDGISTSDISLRYCVVKMAECITARHLLTKIVSNTIASVRPADGDFTADKAWIGDAYNARCEHVSSLPVVLADILHKARCRKFVLVLDGLDDMREGGQMLPAALARIGESVGFRFNRMCDTDRRLSANIYSGAVSQRRLHHEAHSSTPSFASHRRPTCSFSTVYP